MRLKFLFPIFFITLSLFADESLFIPSSYPYNKLVGIQPFSISWKKGLPWEKDEDFEHAPFLERLLLQSNAKVVIELGSNLGGSAVYISQCLPTGGKLYAVDLWDIPANDWDAPPYDKNAPVYPLESMFLCNMIHAQVTDKVVPVKMSTQEAIKFFIKNEIKPDLVYVDAAHDEASVYEDIQAYFPLIKGHGIICGDDWNFPERTVERAVSRFAQENNLQIWVSPTNGRLWVLIEP